MTESMIMTTRHAHTGTPSDEIVDIDISHLHEGLSPRAAPHDAHHAATLAEVFPQLPPIVVHASTMRIIDGVHRVLAARLLGKKSIRARLFHGSEFEASVEAVRANVVHGKPLTITEREAAALTLFSLQADWSDRRIAAVCGLSPMTVGRLRGHAAANASSQVSRRVGRDGKRRPVDPIKTRHLVADTLKENPHASTRQVAEVTGASQATVRDVRARMERGEDVLSPRLARAYQRQQSGGDTTTPPGSDNTSPLSPHVEPAFAQWFESHRLKSDEDWLAWVDRIPIGHVYAVADEAHRCGDIWHHFAGALEARARQNRKRRRTAS